MKPTLRHLAEALELKQLLPPAKVEYVEKQPTLEDAFLAIVGDDGKDGDAGNDGGIGTDA